MKEGRPSDAMYASAKDDQGKYLSACMLTCMHAWDPRPTLIRASSPKISEFNKSTRTQQAGHRRLAGHLNLAQIDKTVDFPCPASGGTAASGALSP
mmetsp:Transcript_20598/g.43946  ORF Transcript_20598/g.43946 Transcript_20598/m.43946 type:complete len:96 (+) Transcript_20598:11-298(+)